MKCLVGAYRPSAGPILFGGIVFAILLGHRGVVEACNVPVFRYALEWWKPDPYRVTLFHAGELTKEQEELLQPFEEASANLVLRSIDVDEIEVDADRKLLAEQAPSEMPCLVVQYPRGLRLDNPIWSGQLTGKAVTGLVDSPLRQELVRRLAAGQTAVWLLLECGEVEKDDAAAAVMEEALQRLPEQLQLPELSDAPEDALLIKAPLEISFSLLRVPRSAAEEQALVAMLLGCERGLNESDEPMVFPVFGRGRSMLPLVGKGIAPALIAEGSTFLVGACSCEVKDLSPGFDLLLAANWSELLFDEPPPSELTSGELTVASTEPERVTIPAGVPSTPPLSKVSDNPVEPNNEESLVRSYTLSMAAVGLLLAIVALIAFKRFA